MPTSPARPATGSSAVQGESQFHPKIVLCLWAAHYAAMAFRIQDSVARGEMDNRVKGIVPGRIWVEERA